MNEELEALEMIAIDLVPKAKEHNKEEIELIKSALETLKIIKSFKLRTVVENEHHLLIIGNKSYEITKEQYEIINEYLEEK